MPRHLFLGGDWAKSWSEKNRTLTLTNGSVCSFYSYDQDVGDFSGASVHLVLHDEGPPHPIYRENKMRTLDVGQSVAACTGAPSQPRQDSQ